MDVIDEPLRRLGGICPSCSTHVAADSRARPRPYSRPHSICRGAILAAARRSPGAERAPKHHNKTHGNATRIMLYSQRVASTQAWVGVLQDRLHIRAPLSLIDVVQT